MDVQLPFDSVTLLIKFQLKLYRYQESTVYNESPVMKHSQFKTVINDEARS